MTQKLYREQLTIIFFLFLLLPVSAQRRSDLLTVRGRVVTPTQKSVNMAHVVFNSTVVVETDSRGCFELRNVRPGRYRYVASCLGYKAQKGECEFSKKSDTLCIVLQLLDLKLKEVTVTATNAQSSKSIIGQDALRHIQPKSVADVLQLLPGGLTKNPTLNGAAQAAIREIEDKDNNNALGTAVMLDGAPLSNDANLQTFSLTRSGLGATAKANGMNNQTTAGRGVDLRTVGADNIESVEVIRGIPSVEYGNLSSGLVIVKTKSGRTPLEMKFKADPFSKLIYAGKGFGLKKGGAVNIGIDWSQSYGDTRRRYLGYERVTASLGYSNVFFSKSAHPLTVNLKSSFYSNINNRKQDEQMQAMLLKYKNKNMGGRVSLHANWRLGGLLSAIDYDISASYAHMLDKNLNWVSNPDGLVTNSMQTGMSEGRFLMKAYFADYEIEGKPYNLFARLKGSKYWQLRDDFFTSLKLGGEYKVDGNAGDGLKYDITCPPQSTSAQTLRPRSYSEIPALQQLSFFAENVTQFEVGTLSMKLRPGLRWSQLFLDHKKSGRGNISVIEPRLNMRLNLLNSVNNGLFQDLSINGGFGYTNKMPILLYLYPNKAYYDNVSLSRMSNKSNQNLGLMTTHVVENTQNINLKPMRGKKWELGINLKVGKMKGYATYFNERYTDEFGLMPQIIWLPYNTYSLPNTLDKVYYDGGKVVYEKNGDAYEAIPKRKIDMATWSRPDNNGKSRKHGIEYAFDFGKIPYISTQLNVDGAWFHVHRTNNKSQVNYIDRLCKYVPVMPGGFGSVSDRVNTNFRFITHIPQVRMVFTTMVQVVWYERKKTIYEDSNGKARYHLSEDGKYYIVSPEGFYNRQQEYRKWTSAYETNPEYERIYGRYMIYNFESDRVSPWLMLNFRFTKELGRVAELSFIANNVGNFSHYHINKHTRGQRQLYPSMYFGTELKIKL